MSKFALVPCEVCGDVPVNFADEDKILDIVHQSERRHPFILKYGGEFRMQPIDLRTQIKHEGVVEYEDGLCHFGTDGCDNPATKDHLFRGWWYKICYIHKAVYPLG